MSPLHWSQNRVVMFDYSRSTRNNKICLNSSSLHSILTETSYFEKIGFLKSSTAVATLFVSHSFVRSVMQRTQCETSTTLNIIQTQETDGFALLESSYQGITHLTQRV